MVQKVIRDQKKSQRLTKPAIPAECSKGQRSAKALLSHCWCLLNLCEPELTVLLEGAASCLTAVELALNADCFPDVLYCGACWKFSQTQNTSGVRWKYFKILERYVENCWDTFQIIHFVMCRIFKYALSLFASFTGSRALGGAYGSPAGLNGNWCNWQSHSTRRWREMPACHIDIIISTYIDSIKTYQDNPRHCISRLKKGFIISSGFFLLEVCC